MSRRPVVDPRFGPRLRVLRQQRGLSLRQLAALTHYGKSYLHSFETGARVPSRDAAGRLDQALGAGGALLALVAVDDPLAYAADLRRVDRAAVDRLAARLAEARHLDDVVGSAPMVPVAERELELLAGLLRDARGPARQSLVAVAGQWAEFAGWVSLATRRWGRAARWLDTALMWSVEAGDQELAATVLSFRGHGAWLAGEYGPMLGLTAAAMRDRGVFIGQRAYDHFQLARGLAQVGQRREAVETLAAGVDLAAEAVEHPGPRPPWHYYRSRAFFMLEAGLVWTLLGGYGRAAELLSAGLAGLPAEMRESEWTGMYRLALAEASTHQ